jgi:co-chaperonin GroES (HSP10)
MKIIGNRVIVIPEIPHETTAGGIYLPELVRAERNTGLVVLIGDTVDKKFDKRRVLFNRIAKTDIQYNGIDALLLWATDIIAILD